MKGFLKILATVIAAAGSLFILILIGDLVFAGWLYSWFFAKIQGFGILSRPITMLVAVWCAALTFLQTPKILRELALRKHDRFALRTVALLTIWLLFGYVMVHPPANWFFNPFSGKALFKYAKTPDGTVKLYPIGYGFNIDPTTGAILNEITPGVAKEYLKQHSGGKSILPEQPPPSPTTTVQTVSGWLEPQFSVELQRCKHQSNGVQCDFTITNHTENTVVGVLPEKTLAVDNHGVLWRGASGAIAGIAGRTATCRNWGFRAPFSVEVPPQALVIKETTVVGTVFVWGGTTAATLYQALEISTFREDEGYNACVQEKPSPVLFRNVPIEKADPAPTPKPPPTPESPRVSTDIGGYPVCAGVADNEVSFTKPLTLRLQPDCWSGWIRLPMDPPNDLDAQVRTTAWLQCHWWNGAFSSLISKEDRTNGALWWIAGVPHAIFRLRGEGDATISVTSKRDIEEGR